MQHKKDFNSTNGSKGKTQELIQKKIPPGAWMFVLCCKRTVVDRKRHERTKKGLIQNKNGSKGKTQELIKKKKFPMVSLEFFTDILVSVAQWP
jgi:hypothetical protein